MFIVSQGSLRVSVYDKSTTTGKMQEIKVRELAKCDYFGEISLIYDSVRSATIICNNYCTLGKIAIETLHKICSNHYFVKQALMNSIYIYND